MDDLLREFLTETAESLDVVDTELVRFEQDPHNARILGNIFRLVHTIKGTCGFLGLPRLEALAHAAETVMDQFRDGAPATTGAVSLILASIDRLKDILAGLEAEGREPQGDDGDLIRPLEAIALAQEDAASPQCRGEVTPDQLERAFRASPGPDAQPHPAPPQEPEEGRGEVAIATQSIRVSVDTLEKLMAMVSELVLTRNQLLDVVRRHEDSEFNAPLQRLSSVTAGLQDSVMKTRMQPIGVAWQKLPRIVRDLAAELGKRIELETSGAETELDRQVLDLVKDPLTHMIRNSADHGLERPDERRAAGKPETGIIRLSARQEGGHIVIAISDDGRGLDVGRIRAKALEAGLAAADELDRMSPPQLQKFIFRPGFSTAATVTSVSGRGVGMDVVRTNIEAIGGTVDLDSRPGEGTTFTITIPITLAIVPALIVEAAAERFAIPQLAVVELVRLGGGGGRRIELINETPVLRHRDRLLPLAHLSVLLGIGEASGDEAGFVVVTQVGTADFGIVVDGVFHAEEIVVKPLASRLRHIAMFSGTTIMGDGAVVMILDPNGVVAAMGADFATPAGVAPRAPVVADTRMPLLVFRAGGGEPKAVPLSLVARIEEIDTGTIERSGGSAMVQYRGRLIPLAAADEGGGLAAGAGRRPMLVFAADDRTMGLLVDEIMDIVEDRLDIDVVSGRPGGIGSAVICGRATEVLDVGHYLSLAFDGWPERPAAHGAGAPRVLLVDDSPFFRDLLAPVLRSAGFEVTALASATEALRLAGEGRRFDAVVADVEMPEMSGSQFAQALRRVEHMADCPMIALSAMAAPGMAERGRRAGFGAHVAKFDRRGLIAALGRASAGAELAA